MLLTGLGRSLTGLEDRPADPPPDTARERAIERAAVSGPNRLAEQALHFVRPALQVFGALRAARLRPWRAISSRHGPVITASAITASLGNLVQGNTGWRRDDLQALQTVLRLQFPADHRRIVYAAPRAAGRRPGVRPAWAGSPPNSRGGPSRPAPGSGRTRRPPPLARSTPRSSAIPARPRSEDARSPAATDGNRASASGSGSRLTT